MCTCTIRWTYSWRIVSDRLEVFPVSYGTFRIGMAPIRQCTVRMSAASEGYQHPLKPSVDSCEMTVVVWHNCIEHFRVDLSRSEGYDLGVGSGERSLNLVWLQARESWGWCPLAPFIQWQCFALLARPEWLIWTNSFFLISCAQYSI
jgi:hypothetical protein